MEPNVGINPNAKDFYIYTATATALAFGASTSTTVTIEADSNFWLQKLSYSAIISTSGAVLATPLILVTLTDTGSSRQLMSSAVPVINFFGTGQLPFILPNPRLFRRNSSISVAFTSYETANSVTLRLSLIGIRS